MKKQLQEERNVHFEITESREKKKRSFKLYNFILNYIKRRFLMVMQT